MLFVISAIKPRGSVLCDASDTGLSVSVGTGLCDTPGTGLCDTLDTVLWEASGTRALRLCWKCSTQSATSGSQLLSSAQKLKSGSGPDKARHFTVLKWQLGTLIREHRTTGSSGVVLAAWGNSSEQVATV